jgi:outer membrane protein TolC
LLAACGTVATLTRPEGDGGWSAAERTRMLADFAVRAGVDLDPAPALPASPTSASSEAKAAAARAPETPAPLTLAAALRLAATGNRRLAEARQQLAIARQQVFEARGRLFPATTGSGRYTWYTDSQTVLASFPTGSGSTVTPAIKIRAAEVGVVNGTVTLPLDLSGEIRSALAAAQAGYRGEAARLWAATLEEELVVIGAYYTLLEAERLRDVSLQTIALHRQQLSYAQDRFANGRLTKNQVLVVQVASRNAEQQRLQRELAIDQARWALNQALGLAIDAPTEVVDVRERPALPPAADALRIAYRENPALHALLEEQQRLDATATALARNRVPRFAAGASVDDTTSDIVDPRLIGAGFVGFEWDLGTDTRREARIAEARVAATQNRTRVERDLRELEQAVRSTHRAAEERLAALATAEVAVGQAEENLRIRSQQFDAGRATSEDVLDAEALLAGERATLASALYQAQTRHAELQRLMGRSLAAPLAEGE